MFNTIFPGLFFLIIVIFRALNTLQTHNNREKYRRKQHKITVIINWEKAEGNKMQGAAFQTIHPPLEIRPWCVFCVSLELLPYLKKEREKDNCACPVAATALSPVTFPSPRKVTGLGGGCHARIFTACPAAVN